MGEIDRQKPGLRDEPSIRQQRFWNRVALLVLVFVLMAAGMLGNLFYALGLVIGALGFGLFLVWLARWYFYS